MRLDAFNSVLARYGAAPIEIEPRFDNPRARVEELARRWNVDLHPHEDDDRKIAVLAEPVVDPGDPVTDDPDDSAPEQDAATVEEAPDAK